MENQMENNEFIPDEVTTLTYVIKQGEGKLRDELSKLYADGWTILNTTALPPVPPAYHWYTVLLILTRPRRTSTLAAE